LSLGPAASEREDAASLAFVGGAAYLRLVMLAMVNFDNPLLWAVFIGWILSVVLHELAHGLVAHFGGDYTIRQRGGLTLNPLQYVDPVNSIVFPAIIFLAGGVPLPGGVTYVREDLLRNRAWRSAVSAAGPASNLLLCLLLVLPFHPAIGWLSPTPVGGQYSNAMLFLGAMALLQMMAALFNLVPVPPLDGFHIINPYLPGQVQEKLASPQVQMFAFWIFFLAVWRIPGLMQFFFNIFAHALRLLGFDWQTVEFVRQAYNAALFG